MSGLEALGAACNILQLIELGFKITQSCKQVYDGRRSADTVATKDNVASLEAATTSIKEYINSSNDKDNKSLQEISKKCGDIAKDLRQELDKLLKVQQRSEGTILKVPKAVFESHRRKSKIERLERSLNECTSIVETHILVNVCKRSSAIELQQSKHFRTLDASLQHFISQYASGCTALTDLTMLEHSNTRQHTTTEVLRAENSIKGHIKTEIRQEATRHASEAEYQRLRNSFKDPEMNERRSRITPPHEVSCGWVFEIDNKDIRWDNLLDWLKGDDFAYWISGVPGSGKSTFVRWLVEQQETLDILNQWSANAKILSHYIWKFGSTEMQRNVRGLWCSLAYQLLRHEPALADIILASLVDGEIKNESSDWSLEKVRKVCLLALDNFESSLCIFIDGLDEISDDDGAEGLRSVFDDLESCPKAKTKLCMASRPEWRLGNLANLDKYLNLISEAGERCTVSNLMLATQGEIRDLVFNHLQPLDFTVFQRACAETHRRVLVRCAGLIHSKESRMRHVPLDEQHLAKSAVVAAMDKYLEPIHRTVVDFLMDSEDGQQILGADITSHTDRSVCLALGNLADCQLHFILDEPQEKSESYVFSALSRELLMKEDQRLIPLLEKGYKMVLRRSYEYRSQRYGKSRRPVPLDDKRHTLDMRYPTRIKRYDAWSRGMFLTNAISFNPTWVANIITREGPDLASEILWHMRSPSQVNGLQRNPEAVLPQLERLLELGANPFSKVLGFTSWAFSSYTVRPLCSAFEHALVSCLTERGRRFYEWLSVFVRSSHGHLADTISIPWLIQSRAFASLPIPLPSESFMFEQMTETCLGELREATSQCHDQPLYKYNGYRISLVVLANTAFLIQQDRKAFYNSRRSLDEIAPAKERMSEELITKLSQEPLATMQYAIVQSKNYKCAVFRLLREEYFRYALAKWQAHIVEEHSWSLEGIVHLLVDWVPDHLFNREVFELQDGSVMEVLARNKIGYTILGREDLELEMDESCAQILH